MSGRRELEDERALLTELGRMIHVAKANHKQRKVSRKAERSRTSASGATGSTQSSAAAAPKDARRRKCRSSKSGGSIRITFTPSFHHLSFTKRRGDDSVRDEKQTAPPTALAPPEKSARFRLELSKRRRETAVAAAEGYLASAISQAEEAGLAAHGVPSSAEGVTYLAEQYAVASKMVNDVIPVGTRTAQLLSLSSGATDVTAPLPPASIRDSMAWAEGQITKERALFAPPRVLCSATTGDDAPLVTQQDDAVPVHEEARTVLEQYAFIVRQPTEPETGDVLPTRCIVKVKGPLKKVTTIVSSQKGAGSLKLNLMQALKKEAAVLLARGAADSSADVVPKAASPSKPQSNSKGGAKHSGRR